MRLPLWALLGAILLPTAQAPAQNKVVRVTFASVTALKAKDGERLDPRMFHFGKAANGRSASARGVTSGLGWSKEKACRWALLAAFLKFQRKARAMGLQLFGVRTFAGEAESDKADSCLCLAGAVVVRSTVKATYLK